MGFTSDEATRTAGGCPKETTSRAPERCSRRSRPTDFFSNTTNERSGSFAPLCHVNEKAVVGSGIGGDQDACHTFQGRARKADPRSQPGVTQRSARRFDAMRFLDLYRGKSYLRRRPGGQAAPSRGNRKKYLGVTSYPKPHSSSRGSLWEAGAGTMSGWPSMMRAQVFQRSTASSFPSGLSFCAFS